ncbi:MAG: FHA domain-containing protein [Bdellovibrionota bacterium]
MPSLMKLESLAGEEAQEIIQVDSGNLTLGRESDNTIVIDSDSVSRLHACFFEVLANWFVRDMNSTNGTMVNGVKVQSGQLRLLRDGDLIQIANFPIRFTELGRDDEDDEFSPPTLLIFYGEHFEADFPLATPGSRFSIGGAEGHLFLENVPPETVQLEIVYNGRNLELHTGNGGAPIIVNGLAVGGVTALTDRDEIDLGAYKIVVNEPSSARSSKQNRMIAAISAQKRQPLSEPPSVQTNQGAKPREWESDQTARKMTQGRKFVFGSSPDEEVTGTIAMSRQEMAYKVGEVSTAQRFSQLGRPEKAVNPEAVEKRQIIFGAFVLLFMIGAVVYFFVLS